MQRDSVITNPKVHVAISLVLLPMLIVFFKPSVWELLGFFVVDSICYFLFRWMDIPLFHRFFPRSRLFFPALHPKLLAMESLDERVRSYQDMAQFPQQRAIFIFAVSLLKVAPGFLYGFWVWGDRYSWGEIAFKGFGICAFTFSYAVGMAFLGYHNQVTETLKLVHRESNWSNVFRAVNPLPHERIFQRFEILCVMGVLVFWLGMICRIPFEEKISQWVALGQILYLSAFGLYFVGQIYATSRTQLDQGLEALIAFHSNSGQHLDPRGLPLSTNPTLAWYQKTLNDMIERNVASEQEIHRWILHKAEDSRFLQLGRVTGLFIHDLATPLTVMEHSISQLEEQPSSQALTHSYVERLRFCLRQITDFVGNLRLSIRDSSLNGRQASPYLAHQAAIRMLSYLHEPQAYATLSLQCQVDPDLRVSIPQPELNQIILNLYSNAVTNMFEYKVTNPSLAMQAQASDQEHVELLVRDNGTGLSLQNFQFITEENEHLPGKEGVGLKLTKRLVELYGGTLTLSESHAFEGSAFVIRLRTAQPGAKPRYLFTPDGKSKTVQANPENLKADIAQMSAEVPQES